MSCFPTKFPNELTDFILKVEPKFWPLVQQHGATLVSIVASQKHGQDVVLPARFCVGCPPVRGWTPASSHPPRTCMLVISKLAVGV